MADRDAVVHRLEHLGFQHPDNHVACCSAVSAAGVWPRVQFNLRDTDTVRALYSVFIGRHGFDELLELLEKRPFLCWIGGQVILVTGILVAAKISWVVSQGTNTMRMKMSRGILYGAVSGILSADCLLLAKSASELLVRTIMDRANQFNRWQSWVILLGLAFLAVTQLFYLHRGLQLCSTSVLYPLVFCVYNIISILDGLLYYRQASRLSAIHCGFVSLYTPRWKSNVDCCRSLLVWWFYSAESCVYPGGYMTTRPLNLQSLQHH